LGLNNIALQSDKIANTVYDSTKLILAQFSSSIVKNDTLLPKMMSGDIRVKDAEKEVEAVTWEPDNSHSLFTKYFLSGMKGEGDKSPYGNAHAKVGYDELEKHLCATMTYFARRYYGRDQVAQFRTYLR
jgi:hypothetical protein